MLNWLSKSNSRIIQIQNVFFQFLVIVARERHTSHKQFKHHDTNRPNVGFERESDSAPYFRRQITWRAASIRIFVLQFGPTNIIKNNKLKIIFFNVDFFRLHSKCESEITDFHAPFIIQKDVLKL